MFISTSSIEGVEWQDGKMSSTIRLSVIIPHLNEPDELRRCLGSLTRQFEAQLPFEIIVVDNGSFEPPSAVCAEFPGVILEVEPTPGPGPARNRGAALARADLLAFIDADCVAAPGWVRAIVGFMEERPDVAFLGGDIRILPARPERLAATEAYESVFSYRARLYVERYGFAATGNMAVRADVFRKVGPFGGIGTMEDTDWGMRASAQGHRIAYLAAAQVFTAPCASYAELARRWDRHVAHDFRKLAFHPADILVWVARSVAIAASPLVEIGTVLRSDRIAGLRARSLAFACLARIRLYRARRMLGLLLRDNTATLVGSWNREKS